jgi:omega-6 fatty acid desaturase (delta-12 desaturase)
VWQLTSTIVLFLAGWTCAYLTLTVSYVLTLGVASLTAVTLVRIFIIQHDCAHRSFFPSPRANDLVGALLGVVTLTPHAYWRRVHGAHHAGSGNLDKRGLGDIETLTVSEYLALGPLQRARYRVFRHPLSVLVIGPAYHFYLHHRWPTNVPRNWRREWKSVMVTNLALAALLAGAWLTIGLDRFLLVHVPITWLAASIGVWLFYVQHQFEETYWAMSPEWKFETASLAGSSYLDLPRFLHWCTGNIGVHHVHHAAPRIPNYRLHSAMTAHPVLRQVTRLTLADTMKCLRLKLWDEERQRLIGFDEVETRSVLETGRS